MLLGIRFREMRYLFAILSLSFISQTAVGQDRYVQLNISVLGQQSCSTNSNTDVLQLALRLRYTNVGKRKLILYKGNRIFYQVFVSRLGESAARRHEFRTSHAAFYDKQPEKIDSNSPGSAFTILAPGTSYETKQSILVPIAKGGEGRVNVSIGPGEHQLNLVVSTWYESRHLGESLRERWRGRGFLWTEPLITNSVGFVVNTQPATTVCR